MVMWQEMMVGALILVLVLVPAVLFWVLVAVAARRSKRNKTS